MAEGRVAEVAVLERMSVFGFYSLYKAWVKRNEAIIEAHKQH
jgi:hypothetical protein